MNRDHYIVSLVQRVKKQDLIAMQTLYEMFAKEMLSTSYRITNDLQESEDVIQEAFLHSFQKIHQLNEGAKYAHWVKRIIVNKSLALLKSRFRFEDVEQAAHYVEEEEPWYQGISFEEIDSAIRLLPDGCRQVFSLYLLDEYTHKEVAEVLHISVSTSKSQYRYALKLLKEQLKQLRT